MIYPGCDIGEDEADAPRQLVIIEGKARIEFKPSVSEISAAESVLIPENTKYRISNIENTELQVMEIFKKIPPLKSKLGQNEPGSDGYCA
jgi:oxalate decarboxylase/phosphoglucose isomerase-like protein (cupin superfamily)